MSPLVARRRFISVASTDLGGVQPDGPATLTASPAGLLLSYRCPVHGTRHEVPYTAGCARRYAAATIDRACCCPSMMDWMVRHGLVRTRLLAWLLIALWVTNLCDLILTLRAISLGRAIEANRLIAPLLHAAPLTAAFVKVGVVTGAVVAFWLLRRRPAILPAVAVLTVVFVALIAYEGLSLLG